MSYEPISFREHCPGLYDLLKLPPTVSLCVFYAYGLYLSPSIYFLIISAPPPLKI